ncbi:MAG TPA: hypothetical protein VKA89_08765 [Solirubrobacterales bacterium]|nr:hypothetical protein [Solirubrobacterales bacterium]
MTRPLPIALISLLAALATGTGVAFADVTITAQVGADQYAAPAYTVNRGERATFQNPDPTASHNVTAKKKGPDGKPLFRSRTVAGSSTPVDGVQYLDSGTYRFECTVHAGMEADLQVTGAGTPVARPRIDVAVPAQSLRSVRGSGKLKVRVRALTDSHDVAILARKGRRRLGSKTNVDLAAGAARVVRVKVTPAGKRALAGLDKAGVSARGSVPFGSPDLARRTLR